MSGEQDRGGAKPAQNPFFDESDAPPPRRVKRAKPPPGIITAGGVDMARAHASGILIREGTAAENTVDEPRVVVAVETDPRKVPTHKRLLDGREASEDGARAAMLPGAGGDSKPWAATAAPAAAAAVDSRAVPAAVAPLMDPDAITIKRNRHELPVWMRLAGVLVLLLLVAGLVRRVRLAAVTPEEPEVAAPPLPARPVLPPPRPVEVAPLLAAPVVTAHAPHEPVAVEPARPAATVAPTSEPEPKTTASATPRVVKVPSPPKPIYAPPFELPGEKN